MPTPTSHPSPLFTCSFTVVLPNAALNGPRNLAISADSATLYITNYDGNNLIAVDLTSITLATVEVGNTFVEPYAVVISPANSIASSSGKDVLFVADADHNRVSSLLSSTAGTIRGACFC